MKLAKTVATLLAASLMFVPALAQEKTAAAKQSEIIVGRARDLDLLNHLLPLVMTKAQLMQLLPPIEKARVKVKEIEKLEAEDLIKESAVIQKAYDLGVQNKQVPSKETLDRVTKLFMAFGVRRQMAGAENAELVLAVMKKSFNAGQLKTAAHSLDMKLYLPSHDPKTLTEDDRLRVFIKDIILDPRAYDLISAMIKNWKD